MGRERVLLIVDDNPADARLIRRAFESFALPCEIHVLSHGEDAIAFVSRRGQFDEAPRPDVILLDLNLPRVSGIEVLDLLKSEPSVRGIPVVIVSTSTSPHDIAECYARGANAYVTKPLELERFERSMRHIADFWLWANQPDSHPLVS